MELTNKSLYLGELYHERFSVASHVFTYPIFFLKFEYAYRDRLKSKFFSLNKFNIFSLHDSDYVWGSGRPLDEAARILADAGVSVIKDRIELQTFPRIFGYAFNPVSFWYAYDENQKLNAVLCEVNNTFGERHFYVVKGERLQRGEFVGMSKQFHVSPFFPVSGKYQFRFLCEPDVVQADIQYFSEDGVLLLKTAVSGQAILFNDWTLIRLLFKFGWMTALITFRIHWNALILWLKHVPYFSKPPPPTHEISK